MELSERMREPFGTSDHSPLDPIEGWWYRLLCKFADEVAQLEAELEKEKKARRHWQWCEGIKHDELQQAKAKLASMELMDAEGDSFAEDIVRENKELKEQLQQAQAELEEKNYACGDALQKLWDEIIVANKPDYGDWEYAGQAYRHLKAEWNDLVKERDALVRAGTKIIEGWNNFGITEGGVKHADGISEMRLLLAARKEIENG